MASTRPVYFCAKHQSAYLFFKTFWFLSGYANFTIMKAQNILISLSVFAATMLASRTFAQHQLSAPLWEAKENLPVPESVLYKADTKELLVSLIDGPGNVKDGKGGVAILNLDGSMKNAHWVTGLNAPKGLAIYRNTLYIADLTAVVSVDIRSGKIKDKLEIEGAVFLNDLTVDDQGAVYVSDTRTHKIYKIEHGKYALFMENVKGANGLKWLNDMLYVLAGTELWQVDAQKQVKVISKGFEKGGDGLEPIGNGDFIVTCWAGIIYYVKANGEFEKLLDVQGKMNTADIGYNAKERIIYVPTFNQNSVVAYQLK